MVPMGVLFVYSFGVRTRTGRTELDPSLWNLESYQDLVDSLVLKVMWRSLWLALATTIICLLVAYPFAYYIATRSPRVRNVLLVLAVIFRVVERALRSEAS